MTKHINFIKHSFLILATMMFTGIASASAQKCNLDKDEKDAFTGEVTRSYKRFIMVVSEGFWEFNFERKGSAYTLGITPVSAGRTPAIVTKGTKMLIKLADNTIIEETVQADIAPTFTGNNTTKWKLTFSTTEETMKKFAASPITDIKLTINGKERNISDLKGKHGDKIQTAASCMIAN